MLIAYLREKKREIAEKRSTKQLGDVLLSEYLMGFLDFYGNKFDSTNKEIYMNNGGGIRKKARNQGIGFSLVYKQNEEINVGQQAFKIWDTFSVFRNRHNFIMNYKFNKKDSILACLINPSGADFNTFLQ